MLRRFACLLLLVAVCLPPATAPSARAAPGMRLGLVDDSFLYWMDWSLRAAFDLGVRTVRVNALWSPNPGSSYSLGGLRFTGAVRQLAETAHGWDVQVVVSFYPARGRDAPRDDASRHQFCAAAAQLALSQPQITAFIIGNEPNTSGYWQPQFNADGTPASPQAYFQTVALCYDMLHAVRPDINVVGPATSSHGNDNAHAGNNASLSPGAFIAGLGRAYRASGRTAPIFDTIDHHPYPLTAAERPWKRHPDARVIGEGDLDRLVAAYSAAFAGTGQPTPGRCVRGRCVGIWYTEDGFQTRPDPTLASSYSGVETDKLALPADGPAESGPLPSANSRAPSQTQQLRDAISLAYCQPYVQEFFNFQLHDEPSLAGWQAGLTYVNGAQKPSYGLYRELSYDVAAGKIDCSRYAAAIRGSGK
jgi:hypothetical protein